MVLIGSLSLTGFPFLTGFYSKDVILELALSKYGVWGNFAYYLGCCTAFCTSFYSFRLIWLTFINKTNCYKTHVQKLHEGTLLMIFPLLFLSLGAIFFGFLTRDMFVGLGTPFFGGSLHVLYEGSGSVDAEFLSTLLKSVPLVFSFFGVLLSFVINFFSFPKSIIYYFKVTVFGKNLYTFLSHK
jgi:NADH-ubiquinone oxidoreductase chain 5